MIETCLRDSGEMADKYPAEMATYCECFVSKITENVGMYEYLRIAKMDIEEQNRRLQHYFQPCLDTLQRRINDAAI